MATATSSEATTTASERVHQLLAATRETIGKVRYCWAVTVSENGGANARPMGRVLGKPGEDEWTVWFLTSGDSRKMAEIQRDPRITISYQRDSDDSYVALVGRAALVADRSEIRNRWEERWNDSRALIEAFPGGAEDPNAVFIRIEVDRIELWVRGVTPEPFGLRGSVLHRDSANRWSIVSG
jgi:general stress protein 26